VHNGAFSCSAKKKKKTTSIWSCLQNFLIFVSTCSNFCWQFGSQFHKTFPVKWAFLLNKIMCFPVFMTYLHFCCFMQITHWA
jgi:hypothetical protein